MAFEAEVPVSAVAIAAISVDLYSPDPLGSEQPGASYSVQITLSDGTVRVRSGNLTPHLTAAQITSLQTFMSNLRTKAVAEFLPQP